MAPSAVESVSHLPVSIASKLQNGSSNGLLNIKLEDGEFSGRVVKTFRCLIADLCEQFKGGHPGSAMGMAAIGVALWKYTMKYSPENPNFFNRDRFVLSNGELRALHSVEILQMLTFNRPYMSLPIHLSPPRWLQKYDIRPTQILPLLKNRLNLPRPP